MAAMKTLFALPLLLALAAPVTFAAEPASRPQRYRLVGEPDVASELILHSDGRFQYFLSAGALDEQSEGRWIREGNMIRLTTMPKPKPAVFSAGAAERDTAAPFTIKVTWPDGRGIAGVDLRVTFDSGEPATGYTQEYGWSLDADEKRNPRSIAFAVPMHALRSQNFPIDAVRANRLTFVLTPNDLGIVDFESLPLTVSKDRLVMHRGGGELAYVRQRP